MKKYLLLMATVLVAAHSFAATYNVAVTNNVFTLATLNVVEGDTVIWNCTQGFHSVLADDNSFTSGPGASSPWSYTHIFNTAGSNPYHCGVHGFGMSGTINVAPTPPPPPPAGPCLDLFFSEYIEGSSNNKAIEIYNPTSAAVDLSEYTIYRANNGNPISDSLTPQGMLNPGDVYCVVNPSADATLLALADTTHTVTFYNGDDALILVHNNTTIDAIGVVGVDPGVNWPVGSGATSEFTLVRMVSINEGETDWTLGDDEWDVYPQNDFTHYGAHSMTPCGPVLDPIISMFSTTNGAYMESVGGLCPAVSIINPVGTATTVDVVAWAGTATSGVDYTWSTPVVFPANFTGNQSFCAFITDDLIVEGIEWVTFALVNPTNNATIIDSFITFTFYDNDSITTDNECADLIISEYIHTYSDDQTIELYNPTFVDADLSAYEIRVYYNGSSSPGNTVALSGTLLSTGVFVAANPNADAAVLAVADITSPFFNWTGNDAIGLFHNNVLIDAIGDIGVDPGLFWPAGYPNGSTSGTTLVREDIVRQGETDWNVSAGHWVGFAQNDFTQLGAHTILACGASPPAVITIITGDDTHMENIGGLGISVTISQPDSLSHTVDVIIDGSSTAIDGVDFTYAPISITFLADSAYTQYIGIGIIDDAILEIDETIVIKIANATNGAVIVDDTFIETIMDNETAPIPAYVIAQVTNNINASCFSDSVGVVCTLNGVVHGINYSSTGLQFYIIDNTGGINVFNFANPDGYVVTEGDDIDVTGVIAEFNGLTEIMVDTIIVNASGSSLVPSDTVTALDESTESEHIVFANAWVVDPLDWLTGAGPGFTVDFTNGTETIAIRIDNQMSFYNDPAPTDTFNIRGIGTQFDAGTDCAGYQMLPFAFDSIPDDDTIGVKDIFNATDLTLYPNPAHDMVKVTVSQSSVDEIVLTDMLGREIMRINHPLNKQNILDLTNIPAGMYLIRAEKNGMLIAEKLIKQ